MDFVSFGSKRTFDDFSSQIPSTLRVFFESVRDYCLSLGENVVEDIRMHRIVFGKSMTFRWFADVEPSNTEIVIKIQENRKEPARYYKISSIEEFDRIKDNIRVAYEKIH